MRTRRLAAGALLGAATSALLALPAAAASDSTMVTYAGTGTAGYSGDGGQATSAMLNLPTGVWLDNAANVFTADTADNRVRKVTMDGVITTVAGSGTSGFSGDGGPATDARLNGPTGVVTTSTGVLYVADTGNNRVRKVAAGVITTVAGTGTAGHAGDGGVATAAQLSSPTGLAVDSTGSLFIADTGNNLVRKVQPDGTIVTFAGTFKGPRHDHGHGPGVALDHDHPAVGAAASRPGGPAGNTGPATKARLDGPTGLATRGSEVLIADTGNNQVRKVSGGTITAFAGTGASGFSGDGGQATSARLSRPTGVAYDPLGNVFVVDAGNLRIRQVTASGVISTLAGNGTAGDSGEGGPCELGQIQPHGGVSADAENVFFGDTRTSKVKRCRRKAGPPPALPEAPGLQSLMLAGSAITILGGGFLLSRRSRRRSMPSAH